MNILESLQNFFKGGGGASVLGVDIGSSAIKMVQLKRRGGKVVLETYGELSLGPYMELAVGQATRLKQENIILAIKDLMREAKINSNNVGVALPLSSSLIAFMSIPEASDKELAEMIPIEARKYIPVPITEVSLDWSIIPREDIFDENDKPKNKNLDVLTIAVHNDVLNDYNNIINGAGLNNSFFELEIFATIRAVIEQGLESHMILDMGASSTKLYIVERGILKASHTINRGSQDITFAISKSMNIPFAEAEKLKRDHGLTPTGEYPELNEIISLSLDYIFYETNRVILNYERKYGKSIADVILSGGGVLLKDFMINAKNNLRVEVKLADPFDKTEAPAFLEKVLEQVGPEFAVSLGVALRKLSEGQV